MDFFKKLKDRIGSTAEHDTSAYWVYVSCEHCNEKLHTRVDLHYDLSIRYGENDEENTYFCRKTLIGSQSCFRPIEIELTFNNQRQLIDKQIKGGQFITKAEFEAD